MQHDIQDDIEEIILTDVQIRNRVQELGAEVTKKYADCVEEGIVLVSILRGSIMFVADLARAISLPIEMDFMAVSSYGNEAVSSGRVQILKDLASSIKGKHVIIVEDIIDSGLTLNRLVAMLETREPASIEIVCLMKKDREDQYEVPCNYVGFPCPDAFIVGYGLDYAEKYRNFPHIGILKREIYE